MSYPLTLLDGQTVYFDDAATAGLLAVAAAKDRCHDAIIAVYPAHRQSNAAIGLYDEPYVAAMRAHILACKAVEDAYTASVETILAGAGTDAAKIAAIAAL